MKRLACIFGGHRWTMRDEDGEVHDVCSRCGKQWYRPSPSGEGIGGYYADERDASKMLKDASSGGGVGG